MLFGRDDAMGAGRGDVPQKMNLERHLGHCL